MKRAAPIGAVVIVTMALAAQMPAATDPGEAARDLTVHEWGTFTTVAGEDGRAVQWLPLGGPNDLPCFVHAFTSRIKGLRFPLPGAEPTLNYDSARATLKATVRMETPVLYFSGPRPAVVDVRVDFRKGLFTEWYPNAAITQDAGAPNLAKADESSPSSMVWLDVNVTPDATPVFRREDGPSHYYAARETDAAPVRVKHEREKFLFYRGVAGFDSPIAATLGEDGRVTIVNVSDAEIPHVVLFSRQGTRHGYRVHGRLRAGEQAVLDRPMVGGPIDAVHQELERTLIAQGLFAKEAAAMIDTWRDSWFEDGLRLFYIVSPSMVDRVLPLHIDPKPKSVVRVFVGRAELIRPSDVGAVTTAFAAKDRQVLERYGRLLGPITDRILASTSDADTRIGMRAQLDAMLKADASRVRPCSVLPAPIDSAAIQRPAAFAP